MLSTILRYRLSDAHRNTLLLYTMRNFLSRDQLEDEEEKEEIDEE